MIVLGFDPGSRKTGYGVVEYTTGNIQYIASGCIKLPNIDFATRLLQLYDAAMQVIATYQPSCFSIEQVFVKNNPATALKLGQARGVLLLSAAKTTNNIFEYSPRDIKKAVVGYGGAEKEQVKKMVQSLLHLDASPQEDAADALAVALCHINSFNVINKYV